MTTIMTAAAAQRSWSQIVKPDCKAFANTKPIKPAARGSLLQSCSGEVVSMSGQYGWLKVYGEVDHPSADQHGGDVYIHKDDVVDSESLYPGDVVTFYVYCDEKGLGAEWCSVEQRAERCPQHAEVFDAIPKLTSKVSTFSADAEEFVPGDAMSDQVNGKSFSFSVDAYEFVPGDGMSDQAASIAKIKAMADVFFRLSQAFDSDDEDDEEDDFELYKSWPTFYTPEIDASTDEGTTDDSENEYSDTASDTQDECPLAVRADIVETFPLANELPPWRKIATKIGKPLPTNFRPPPGLSLTLEDGQPW